MTNTEQTDVIVRILKDSEDTLSDGYKYYCGKDRVDKVLKNIALDIITSLNTITYRSWRKTNV